MSIDFASWKQIESCWLVTPASYPHIRLRISFNRERGYLYGYLELFNPERGWSRLLSMSKDYLPKMGVKETSDQYHQRTDENFVEAQGELLNRLMNFASELY